MTKLELQVQSSLCDGRRDTGIEGDEFSFMEDNLQRWSDRKYEKQDRETLRQRRHNFLFD